MTRREWARKCLQDLGCPDGMVDLHLMDINLNEGDWTTPDDGASGGMLRHNERTEIIERTRLHRPWYSPVILRLATR